ncbi:MAG: hypothetical protein AB8B58_10060 [Roseobacter sp.]
MLEQIKTVTGRSMSTLVQDMIGAASLVTTLIVLLYLPSFF